MDFDKPLSLVEKQKDQSNDLLINLVEYLEGLDERDQPISSIAVAIRFSNGDSTVTFHGDDLVGLLGAIQALTSKVTKKIEEGEVVVGFVDD